MIFISAILSLSLLAGYTGGFREGDWVNFTNFRFITSAAMDQTVVYFGTTNGVIRYDRYAQQWLDPLTITDGIPHERVDNIAYDPDMGRIWVLTPNGSAYYQPTFKEWYSGGDFPAALARNDFDPQKFSILTTQFGYSYQDGEIQDPHMQQFALTRGVSDDFDSMYVGTWGMGPLVINTRYGDLSSLPFGPYSGDLTTVVELGSELWIGDDRMSGGALSMYDRAGDKWNWYPTRLTSGLASSRLTSGILFGEKKQIAWLGTDYGLVRYQIDNDDFTTYADFSTLPSNFILSVAVDSLGVFAGTDNGLGYLPNIPESKQRKKSNSLETKEAPVDTALANQFSPKSLVGFRINCENIIDDFLYLGTDRGVLRRSLSSNSQFEYVDTPGKMLSVEVYDIAHFRDSLFFLTPRDIQIINQKTGESSTLTDQRYFGQWRLRKIIVDNSNIWVSSDMGLWKYRLKDGYSRLFTVNDGMISDDVGGIVLDGDYIWLSTPRALIKFYWNNPDRID